MKTIIVVCTQQAQLRRRRLSTSWSMRTTTSCIMTCMAASAVNTETLWRTGKEHRLEASYACGKHGHHGIGSSLAMESQELNSRFHSSIHNDNKDNHIQRCNLRFFTISSLRCEPSPTRTLKWPGQNRVQITCSTSSAYHVQHVMLHSTWYEGTAQLLSLTEFKSHLLELYNSID